MVRNLEHYLADQARSDADDRNLVSRTEERREKQRHEAVLLALASQLMQLKQGLLLRLELPAPALEIMDEIRVIESAPARNRALKRLRAELREVDPDVIKARLAAFTDPSARRPPSELETWRQQLLTGGDSALNGFMELYRAADRAQLRNLVRNFTRAKDAERPRAEQRLTDAIRRAMQARTVAPESATTAPTLPDAANQDT